ncbi:MAG: tyrosine-type recombinase/integrase [Lachnospiraceae bacterium]|nr:tyrosine-type recombinase/integrase [Lachnospiraceae bacterium]
MSEVIITNCAKCKRSFQDDAVFCPYCGKKQAVLPRKTRAKSRGNGTGCAYYSAKYRYWIAQVITDWIEPTDRTKRLIPVKKTKGGFKRREDALAYCQQLKDQGPDPSKLTLKEIFDQWEDWYAPRIDASTMAGYRAAFSYYGSLYTRPIIGISAGDLQECMDACPRGKRTHQNMKVVAGLVWKYAKDKHIVSQVESENLYTGKGASKKRESLTDIEVEKIRQAIGQYRYAEYIFCLCYLGFRPGEMLEIRKDQLTEHKGRLFIIEGKKTAAGISRTVPVHQKIEQIIRSRLMVPGTDLVFPQYTFSKASKKRPVPLFTGFKEMSDNYFREMVFKPICASLGIAEGKVPYSARHTFSDKLKSAAGDDIDKARLIGHSDYTFTQTRYQSTNLDELKAVVDSMK